MIFDRTQADVVNAINIRKNVIQQFKTPTENDLRILERGFLTLSTLDRILNKQRDLSEKMKNALALNFSLRYKQLFEDNIFRVSTQNMILDNELAIRKALKVKANTPEVPIDMFNYTNVNDIEKILADVEENTEKMLHVFPRCGAFISGQVRGTL